MASTAIRLKEVGFQVGAVPVLRQISLQLEKGLKLVLIGPSGSGKSVLLKLIAGLIEPSEGEVWVSGVNIHQCTPQERESLSLRMGMLFQRNALFDSLTVGENVAFPLREVKGLSEAEIRQKVEYFLQAVGLEASVNLYPSEISGGMQKRLGIARALALDPEIILYDDPTAGLDPITSRKIIDLICDLQREKSSTLIAVTNDMARAYQLADQIALVEGGGVSLSGTVEETKRHPDPRVQQFIRGQLQGPLTEGAEE